MGIYTMQFANASVKRHGLVPFRRALKPLRVSKQSKQKANIMGDKSPKATSKHATQKQVKTTSAQQKKQQAIAAKQVAGKKK